MAQFDFYLNRQGVRGPQGVQGEQGFSPIITVATNTLSEYVLQIQTQNNTFLTANLREHKDDLGGTYIRYNRETGVMYAGDADIASESQLGVVRFATATDIEREDESSVVSPADVADMIAAVDPSGDISDLQDRVTTLEGKTESLEGSVSDNSLAISQLQSSVSGLLANYVPKTRTINGYALSANITLTASDVNAYSKSETDALLADKADISDLPDMNNYYNTTQIDLMLNDKADISDIPTVGNGTVTFTQGGVSKGTITTNQSGDATIALDAAGSSLTAGTAIDITNDTISVNYDSAKGLAVTGNSLGIRVDGTTIDFDASGNLKSLAQALSYSAGTGIDITSDVISVDFTDVATASQGIKADTAVQPSDLATVATTGDYTDLINKPTIPIVPTNVSAFTNDAGYITSASLPDVSNMATTDTNQTISGIKTFTYTQKFDGGVAVNGIYNQTGNDKIISVSVNNTDIETASLTTTRNNTAYTVLDSGNIGSYAITSNPVMTGATSSTAGTSGLVPAPAAGDDTKFLSGDGTYKTAGSSVTVDQTYNAASANPQSGIAIAGAGFLTSIPIASTSTLGGVKVDGTTVTIDSNGVISSSGGGGTVDQTYDATSTNAQSGTAVAEAVEDKVDNSDLADITEIYPTLSGLGMPSDTYEDLTFTHGASYIAPADGYFSIQGYRTNGGTVMGFFNVTANIYSMTNCMNTDSGSFVGVVISAHKGDAVQAYNYNNVTSSLKFVYAVGSESEAS